jgi:hypothetical protein
MSAGGMTTDHQKDLKFFTEELYTHTDAPQHTNNITVKTFSSLGSNKIRARDADAGALTRRGRFDIVKGELD